ncbi:MAG: Flp family type IVb pilin [Microthrixaceae bacterium]
MATIRKLDDRGAAFMEYALLVAFIAAVVFVSVATFGGNTVELFDTAATNVHAP